jgi:DNA-binding Xre family transcriptional regulator
MLYFNPKRIMAMRGIDKMFNYLHKNGFIRTTATYLLNNTASHIKIEHIGKLCFLLNCTPNDLFEWHPDNTYVLTENHALNTLIKHDKAVANIKELLKEIPPERLGEVESLLKGLKDG